MSPYHQIFSSLVLQLAMQCENCTRYTPCIKPRHLLSFNVFLQISSLKPCTITSNERRQHALQFSSAISQILSKLLRCLQFKGKIYHERRQHALQFSSAISWILSKLLSCLLFKGKKHSPSTKLPLEMSCFQAIPLFIKYLSMSLPSIAYLRPLDFKYRVQGVPIYGQFLAKLKRDVKTMVGHMGISQGTHFLLTNY